MLPSSDLQKILKTYAEEFDVDIDPSQLANYITHKTYAVMRSQRPNLGALLVAACAVIEASMKANQFNVSVSLDNHDNVEVQRDDTEECIVSSTMVEAMIHFADEL